MLATQRPVPEGVRGASSAHAPAPVGPSQSIGGRPPEPVQYHKIFAVPMTLAEANQFVAAFHRHSRPVVGAKFSIGASDGHGLSGVAITGRPVSRILQDGTTAEVNRCCVVDGSPKGTCSFLYAACWRAWRAMGGRKLITYTLASESGASLRGAGWTVIAELAARGDEAWNSRERSRAWHPTYGQQKLRWEIDAESGQFDE